MATRVLRQQYVVHKQGNQPPTAPTGLLLVSIDAGTAVLDWANNPEPQVTGYHVWHSLDGISYSIIQSPTSSNATITGLNPFLHYFKVTAFTINNESGFSFVVSGADTTAPATPTGLQIIGFTGTTTTLDWTDNTEVDFAYYRVYQSTNDVSYSLVGNNLTNSVYVALSLTAGTTYYYKVTATDQSGNESARTASVTIQAVAAAPVSLDPEGIFFGRSDLTAGSDFVRVTSMPANTTVTLFTGGSFTIQVAAGATPGLTSFGYQLSKSGVTTSSTKAFTIT